MGGGSGRIEKVMAATPAAELRPEFLLDPEVAFLNHGSFGACPRPVFERYQAWQRALEVEPVDFLARRLPGLLDEARAVLADYVGCSARDLAFAQNATTGVNLAARSLDLGPGDEILATDLEYGACDLAWDRVCGRTGARYVRAPIPLPLRDPSEFVEALFASASERTRAVYLSHVTSETALVLPVEAVVARARELGLLTIVDGAHAPAQVPVDLAELGADFYSGNCHKWLCAPKGAGFLHVRPEHQDRVDAAIVGWGYTDGRTFSQRIEIQGTRDPAAWLAVPDAIRFQAERGWDLVSERCRHSRARPAAASASSWERTRSRQTRCSRRWQPSGSPAPHPTCPTGSSLGTASRSRSAAPTTTSSASPLPPTRRAKRSTAC